MKPERLGAEKLLHQAFHIYEMSTRCGGLAPQNPHVPSIGSSLSWSPFHDAPCCYNGANSLGAWKRDSNTPFYVRFESIVAEASMADVSFGDMALVVALSPSSLPAMMLLDT